MKKIVFLAAALMASMFILTSCEKENVAEMAENNATEEVKAANYVLLQKGYVDEYGNVGNLYINEKYPEDRYFEIYKQTRAHQKYIGSLIQFNDSLGSFDHYDCLDEAKNCWKNGNTVSWNTGTLPSIRILNNKK